MKGQWTLISALIFALITAIFAVANVDPVRVNFIFTETRFPMILVILGSTLLGGLIMGSFGIIRQFRLQRKIRTLEKQLQEYTGAQSQNAGRGEDLSPVPVQAGGQADAAHVSADPEATDASGENEPGRAASADAEELRDRSDATADEAGTSKRAADLSKS